MAKKDRKWGEIPAWMIKAPVTLLNYDQKAEHHGVKLAGLKDNWPFVSNRENEEDTANREAWEDYFWKHLGGWPRSYRLFRDGVIPSYNFPTVIPEEFDTSYRSPKQWALATQTTKADLMHTTARIPASPIGRHQSSDPCNLFIPKGHRGYDRMLEAGKAGELGRSAQRMADHFNRAGHPGAPVVIDPHNYYRIASDGLHCNYNDFLELVGRIAPTGRTGA